MSVYQFDPLTDPRWEDFAQSHPQATVFHTSAWLEALRRTYKYDCVALTTSKPGAQLTNGMVFCKVSSRLTGSRWVSVPFADHCDPLFDSADDLRSVLDWACWESRRDRNLYVEIRPLRDRERGTYGPNFSASEEFRFHFLDMRPPADQLLRSFNVDSVQRRLRRAEKAGLAYQHGRSFALLKTFYKLMISTRRRHGMPPQPLDWYSNLLNTMGNKATISIVSQGAVPLASMLTLRHGGSVVYKYGCSDAAYKHLAGNTLLFWRAIQDAKESGAEIFDMGRSDIHNSGLINFKSHWGSVSFPLVYWRFDLRPQRSRTNWGKARKLGSYVLSQLPDWCLTAVGSALYKHAG